MLKNPACLDPKPENLYFPPKKGDYVYFEGPPSQSVAYAADAAMFAYARYGQTRMNEEEFKQILRDAGFKTAEMIGDCFVDNSSTARGFFAANDELAILAFRGTEKDNKHDIEADLDALPVPQESLGGRSTGLVHQGFQRYLRPVWQRVTQLAGDYRASHNNQEIRITGHSLGAAIATLAFQQLQDDHTALYTFGCPRVGNQVFCDSVSALGQKHPCYRAVDLEDVVTHVPFDGLFGYQHPNFTVLWIDSNHKVVRNPSALTDIEDIKHLAMAYLRGELVDPLPGPLADHSPVRYCHWFSVA